MQPRQTETNRMTNMHAIEMVIDIRDFVSRRNQRELYAAMKIPPHIALPPLFNGSSTRHKLANIISQPFMKLIKKTTVMDFLVHQKQARVDIEQEIELLRSQIRDLRRGSKGKN